LSQAKGASLPGEGQMALNPALDQHGLPIPFIGEVIVLMRKGIELHVSNVPG